MASKEPPLIRSTKAFSVEIPEGSNSAKARRSDIVAGELEGVKSIQPHFEEQLASKNQTLSGEDEGNPANLSITDAQAPQDSFANVNSGPIKDQLMGISNEHLQDSMVSVGTPDATKDGNLDVENEGLHDTQAGVAKDNLNDHLVGMPSDNTQDHVVGIASSNVEDQHAGVANEKLQDHLVGAPNDNSSDHIASVAKENTSDHFATVANENIDDHIAAIPEDDLNDNHAAIPDDAVEDHHIPITEPAEPIPSFVGANDDFPDGHMEIEHAPEPDTNVQTLSDEALVDHIEHVNEEKPALVNPQLAVIPEASAATAGKSAAVAGKSAAPKQVPKPSTVSLTPEMVKLREVALAEKQHKMEEFHGRVEAIRNTVSNINAKLDQISPHDKKS